MLCRSTRRDEESSSQSYSSDLPACRQGSNEVIWHNSRNPSGYGKFS